MGSIAGKICAPYMTPYTGTKHALEGISLAEMFDDPLPTVHHRKAALPLSPVSTHAD